MTKNNFKISILRATTDFKMPYPYQSIPLKTAQFKVLQIIQKNNQPSQETIKNIIIKNKLLREPLLK